MENNIEFDVAEVLGYDHTYDWVPYSDSNDGFNNNNLFALKVRSCSGYIDRKTFIARPANNNIKKIPLIGEIVLLFKSFNQYASNSKTREIWYYLDTINIQSSINENRLPGLSLSKNLKINVSERKPAGFTFDETKKISPLQPYEGDMLFEGRFGNSIRFGSTISTVPQDKVHKSPSWTGDVNGDPIIILSNGQDNLEDKEFVVENINKDNSSIYLTSTQRIPIILGSQEKPNSLTGTLSSRGHESKYQDSQLLAVSNRIILKARNDLAVIDSPIGIVLNSTGDIKLGSDDATESMVHGEVLLEILTLIIEQFTKSIGQRFYFKFKDAPAEKAQKLLDQLLSSTYKMKKNIDK
tara:strand:- start:148 stop:1206 length:1059 start_codon:yes stop_codon:yes gene_type:complete